MAREKEKFLEVKIERAGFSTMFSEDDLNDSYASHIVKSFEDGKYTALYNLSFQEPRECFSDSLLYLQSVASGMISLLVKTRDIETLRERVEPDFDEQAVSDLASRVPFIRNSEYVDESWIRNIWSHLLLEYRFDIVGFEGSVEEYFNSNNNRLHVPGYLDGIAQRFMDNLDKGDILGGFDHRWDPSVDDTSENGLRFRTGTVVTESMNVRKSSKAGT